jgi:hypothetical protein
MQEISKYYLFIHEEFVSLNSQQLKFLITFYNAGY